jgi:hypothetical protein
MPRAHELTELEGFPAPYARVGNTPVWIVADVAVWFRERGRDWRAPGTTASDRPPVSQP